MSSLGDARHAARERALELLYEAAIKERSIVEIVEALAVEPDERTKSLLLQADASRARAHELISAHAIDWPLERIAVIDRLVMELAIGEMLSPEPAPLAVIIDEAVEIAKTYSGDNAPYFVNGVLSAVANELQI